MSLLSYFESRLVRAAKKTVEREKPYIIAVTGSVGKSSTKKMIGALLGASDPVNKTRVSPKSYNNELGVALSIFGYLAPGRSVGSWMALLWTAWLCENGFRSTGIHTFVLEMGADHPGDIARLAKMAPPQIAVVTAVTPEGQELAPVHVANYPSIEALAEEKATLVKALPKTGAAVLNADDPRVFGMRHVTDAHIITFGETDAADERLLKQEVIMKEESYGRVPVGLRIEVGSFNRLRVIELPGVIGRPYAYAVCAALAVAATMDLGVEIIPNIQQYFEPLAGRTRIIPGVKETTLIDDTYNASPAAVISAIRDLKQLPLLEHQRRVVCLGEMRELGAESANMHRRVGVEVATQGIDLLVACGTLGRVMAEGARANGMREDQIKICEDTPEAGPFLKQWIQPGDVILAKASQGGIDDKGVRMERVIKELMREPQRAGELLVRQEEAWSRK